MYPSSEILHCLLQMNRFSLLNFSTDWSKSQYSEDFFITIFFSPTITPTERLLGEINYETPEKY